MSLTGQRSSTLTTVWESNSALLLYVDGDGLGVLVGGGHFWVGFIISAWMHANRE